MSLKLSFKKAYTKVFNGEDSARKILAAVATTFFVPIGGAFYYASSSDYSAERTALGNQQYERLVADIDALAVKTNRLHQAANEVKDMTQVLVLDPKNAELKEKLKRQQEYQVNFRREMDSEMMDFRNRFLLAEGISEKDAVQLINLAENKTGYVLSTNDPAFRKRMQYLDECQAEASHKALQPGEKKAQTDLVWQCQIQKFEDKGKAAGDFPFMAIPATGLSLMFMSILGGRFRRQIPKDELDARQRAEEKRRRKENEDQTATLKITYKPVKK